MTGTDSPLEKGKPDLDLTPVDACDEVANEFSQEEGEPFGSDYIGHEYPHVEEGRLRDLPLTFWNLARFPLLALIRLYQMTFSRVLPANTCRFYPSCSHYGYQAVYKYGALRGSVMAAWRVLRCNPFSKGGFDPVP